MKQFERFQELFIPKNINVTKKHQKDLQKDALKWFKDQFGASFGSTTNINTKDVITWHYTSDLLMFGVPEIGDYVYSFIIKMIHFDRWALKEFYEGYGYGQICSKSKMKPTNFNYRDGNPYSDFYRNQVWDAGYICGLSNFSFKKYYR